MYIDMFLIHICVCYVSTKFLRAGHGAGGWVPCLRLHAELGILIATWGHMCWEVAGQWNEHQGWLTFPTNPQPILKMGMPIGMEPTSLPGCWLQHALCRWWCRKAGHSDGRSHRRHPGQRRRHPHGPRWTLPACQGISKQDPVPQPMKLTLPPLIKIPGSMSSVPSLSELCSQRLTFRCYPNATDPDKLTFRPWTSPR